MILVPVDPKNISIHATFKKMLEAFKEMGGEF